MSEGESMLSAPAAPAERLPSLDLIRGVAVMGILFVNINDMALPGSSFSYPFLWGERSFADSAVFALNYTWIQLKFYSLFSILFGAGLWLQTQRIEQRDKQPYPIVLRRLGLLFLLGMIHALFFWRGDILAHYAFAGLLVYSLRKTDPARLLVLAGLSLTIPPLLCTVPTLPQFLSENMAQGMPADWTTAAPPQNEVGLQNYGEMITETPRGLAMEARLYSSGSFQAITQYRAASLAVSWIGYLFFMLFPVLGYMLAGMAIIQSTLFQDPERMRGFLWKVFLIGLILGLALTLPGAWLVFQKNGWAMLGTHVLRYFGSIPLTAAYLCAFLLACQSPLFLRVTRPLRIAGRMALTNYLLPSIILTALFYGYGLGQFGLYGYATLAGMAAATCVLLVLLSMAWNHFFRFGPFEWLWRCGTYGRWIRISKSRATFS